MVTATLTPVSYTHLDVYKRQAYAQRVIDDQRYRDYLFVFDDNLPGELMDKLAIQAYDEKQDVLFDRIYWGFSKERCV